MRKMIIALELVLSVVLLAGCNGATASDVAGQDSKAQAQASSLSSKVEVTQYTHIDALEEQGRVRVKFVGVAINKTAAIAYDIFAHVKLYKADGTLLTESDSTLVAYCLNPDQSVGFDVFVFPKSPAKKVTQWASEEVSVVSSTSSFSHCSDRLVIKEHAVTKDYLGHSVVRGVVANTSNQAPQLIRIILTSYDADGKIVTALLGSITADLGADNTAPFAVSLGTDKEAAATTRYELHVEALAK